MKQIINFLTVCLLACSISSCSSYQKLTIKGKPGTAIFAPVEDKEPKKLGIIEDNGETIIKVNRSRYYPFLLTYNAETGNYHPFGLNYKYDAHTKRQLIFWGIQVPLALPTLYTSLLCFNPGQQMTEGYKYLETQTIRADVPNAPYNNIGERRKVKGIAKSSLLNHQGSSSAAKLLSKDYGKMLQGEYSGAGKLLQGENTIETYNNMTIAVTSVNRSTVSVKVLLNKSEEIFPAINYIIKHQGENNFVLISEEDESATITINKDNAVYNNPNVNIDGEIYKLHISANR